MLLVTEDQLNPPSPPSTGKPECALRQPEAGRSALEPGPVTLNYSP